MSTEAKWGSLGDEEADKHYEVRKYDLRSFKNVTHPKAFKEIFVDKSGEFREWSGNEQFWDDYKDVENYCRDNIATRERMIELGYKGTLESLEGSDEWEIFVDYCTDSLLENIFSE